MSVLTWDRDFEDFAVRRSPALLRTAVFLAGDHHAGEDLLQSALARTARRWGRARAHPDAYVRQVLVNLARDGWRARLRRVEEVALESGPADVAGSRRSLVDRPVWPAPSLSGTEAEVDARDELLCALRRLPGRQRTAVVLRFWEDLSVAETAVVMGCTEGTVKSATSRGLERLREVLGATWLTVPEPATPVRPDGVTWRGR